MPRPSIKVSRFLKDFTPDEVAETFGVTEATWAELWRAIPKEDLDTPPGTGTDVMAIWGNLNEKAQVNIIDEAKEEMTKLGI